jgi:hypothetical protein
MALKGWMSLFDESTLEARPEFLLRLPSLFLYGLMISVWPFLLRRHIGWKAACLATALLALNGLLLRQAIEVRMYTGLVLCHALLAAAWLRLLRHSPRAHLPRATLLALASLGVIGALIVPASHIGTAALVFGTAIISRKLPTPLFRRQVLRSAIPFFSGLVATLPYYVAHLILRYRPESSLDNPEYGLESGTTILTGMLLRDQNMQSGDMPVAFFVGAIGLAALSLVLFCLLRRRLGRVGRAVAAVALPLPALMMLLGSLARLGIDIDLVGPPRYLVPLVPYVAIAMALLVLRISSPPWRAMLAAALIALLTISANFTTGKPGMEFREVALALRQNLRPSDLVLVVPHDAVRSLDLYLGPVKVPLKGLNRFERDRELLRGQLATLLNEVNGRLILFSFRGSRSTVFRLMESSLSPAQWPQWGQGFGDLDVLIWDHPSLNHSDQATSGPLPQKG